MPGPIGKEYAFAPAFPPDETQHDNPGPWRHLAVEVTSEKVILYWGEDPGNLVLMDEILRRRVDQLTQLHLRTRKLNFTFQPRSPLGLYVQRGTASFRNVVLQPYPNP